MIPGVRRTDDHEREVIFWPPAAKNIRICVRSIIPPPRPTALVLGGGRGCAMPTRYARASAAVLRTGAAKSSVRLTTDSTGARGANFV